MATRRRDDDSSEEEATAIDLRSTPSSIRKPAPKTIAPGPPKSKLSRASSEPLHKSDLDSADEEATEFLAARPASVPVASEPSASNSASNSVGQPRARGRAVPLADGEEMVVSENRGVSRASLTAAAKAEQPVTAPLTSPENMDQLPRAPRPLPGRITNVKSEIDSATGTSSTGGAKSTPRITRIFVDPTNPKNQIGPADFESETDPGAGDKTDPPELQKARPLPAPGKPPTVVAASPGAPSGSATEKRSRPKTVRVPSESTSETLEADPADGTLIVEVPDGAVVFLDGIERGKGPSLKLREIDRYAKHAVRIHCAGYLPWSGSVCLEGRTAAKIRPGLKKREK